MADPFAVRFAALLAAGPDPAALAAAAAKLNARFRAPFDV